MTDQEFNELADIIFNIKNKKYIVEELKTLYRFGTDDGWDAGYEKGKQAGYKMCIEEHDF